MMQPYTPATLLRSLFDAAAYAQVIAPVLAPLTADFATYAAPCPTDSVLDLGTGTGALARVLAPRVAQLMGLDMVADALRIARRDVPGAMWVAGDVHAPPFAPGAFSLVVGSLALNMTVPWRSLPAIRRLLAPGGRLVLQEWGPQDSLSRDLEALLDAHLPETLPAPLEAYTVWLADDPPLWGGYLQDADDYRDWLTDLGLEVEDAVEGAPVTLRVPSADAYLSWWLAWPVRRQAAQAFSEEGSAAFVAAARARLRHEAGADGGVAWQPALLRARARLGV